MIFTFRRTIFLLLTLGLSACSSPGLDDYKALTPSLALENFFDGELKAYGIVFNRSGKMTRRFEVKLEAKWQGKQGEIKEWFIFDDGEKSTRIWQLEKLSANKYQGVANDVIGIAAGQTSGSALYWRYNLSLDVDGTNYEVVLDDWMYLLDEKRLFNKTDIIKWGFKVGEVILFIEKV